MTWLNETEASDIAALPFILVCTPVLTAQPKFSDSRLFYERHDSSSKKGFASSMPQRRADIQHLGSNTFYYRNPSAEHLQLVSQQRGAQRGQFYTFDPTLGEGVSLYIIDSGFNTAHEVCHYSAVGTWPTFASRNLTQQREVHQ
jgi:hypothetical protein